MGGCEVSKTLRVRVLSAMSTPPSETSTRSWEASKAGGLGYAQTDSWCEPGCTGTGGFRPKSIRSDAIGVIYPEVRTLTNRSGAT